MVDSLRPLILGVNLPHFTPGEHSFWESTALHLAQQGWRLTEIRTDPGSPRNRNGMSVLLPSSPATLARDVARGARPASDEGWGWITDFDLLLLEDWERRRHGCRERHPSFLLGLLVLAGIATSVIDALDPALIVTQNKMDPLSVLCRAAGRPRGIPLLVTERSPLDSIWVEPEGLFSESTIWALSRGRAPSTDGRLREAGAREVQRLRGNPHGFRPETRRREGGASDADSDRKVVFLPLDMSLWTGWAQPEHPMRCMDYPLYGSPAEAVADLAGKVAELDATLVVKEHPMGSLPADWTCPPNARLYEGDLGEMLRSADCVVVFNSKTAFPALAMGKPVVTLAPNPVVASGATYHCTDCDQIGLALQRAMRGEQLPAKLRDFGPFVGWLAEEVFYGCEDTDHASRGPRQCARDLVEAARDDGRKWGQVELSRRIQSLQEQVWAGHGGGEGAFERALRFVQEHGAAACARRAVGVLLGRTPPFSSVVESLAERRKRGLRTDRRLRRVDARLASVIRGRDYASRLMQLDLSIEPHSMVWDC